MVLQHNLRAMFTEKQLNVNTKEQKKSAERLSTGFKINRSADDAAGLTMSENMRSQIRGLNRATTNAEDAASFCQVVDGAMGEMQGLGIDRIDVSSHASAAAGISVLALSVLFAILILYSIWAEIPVFII